MLVIQRPTVEPVGEEENNRQRFSVSPLEPGFGHTLGNSLRRTLLSSIPGAAITAVRFDDALHEFGTINGVTEDVTDIILNLKDLVLTSVSDEPVTLRLDVRGPADVTGADIQATSDVEVLNASNARAYAFGFNDDRTFDIVASDGGLLAGPVPAQRVQLSPGERAEIVVRMRPGETVQLNSTPPDLGTGADARYSGGTFTVTVFSSGWHS